MNIYRQAFKRVFFEPRPAVLRLYERFNGHIVALNKDWWESIRDSREFEKNIDAIRAFRAHCRVLANSRALCIVYPR